MHHKKNNAKFKSYTDINNYNNFLLQLDKTQTIAHNYSKTNDEKQGKQYIDKTLRIITDSFINSNFTDPHFTGLTYHDSLISSEESYISHNMYNFSPKSVKTYEETVGDKIQKKNKINITKEINNIGDLISLIDEYPIDKNTEYNINMNALHNIKKPLIELNKMIGIKSLKQDIVDQIIFYIQNLHTLKSELKGNDFMHTVIYGPPGTGKTEIAKIIGSIFSKLGMLSNGTFKKVTRADLIAGYLGQTALKTREVIKESLGGVLFIDEAYSLGNEEKRDSFSKECIDTLCEALSDHKDNLMVIIVGYEKDLNNCFFNYNQGLNSRFAWRYKMDEYTAEDLYKIFLKQVEESGWFLSEKSEITVKWFEKHKKSFKFYGRDIETLFAKTKIAHSRRVFCLDSSVKKYLTIKDLDNGMEIYLKNENSGEKEKEKLNQILCSMYT